VCVGAGLCCRKLWLTQWLKPSRGQKRFPSTPPHALWIQDFPQPWPGPRGPSGGRGTPQKKNKQGSPPTGVGPPHRTPPAAAHRARPLSKCISTDPTPRAKSPSPAPYRPSARPNPIPPPPKETVTSVGQQADQQRWPTKTPPEIRVPVGLPSPLRGLSPPLWPRPCRRAENPSEHESPGPTWPVLAKSAPAVLPATGVPSRPPRLVGFDRALAAPGPTVDPDGSLSPTGPGPRPSWPVSMEFTTAPPQPLPPSEKNLPPFRWGNLLFPGTQNRNFRSPTPARPPDGAPNPSTSFCPSRLLFITKPLSPFVFFGRPSSKQSHQSPGCTARTRFFCPAAVEITCLMFAKNRDDIEKRAGGPLSVNMFPAPTRKPTARRRGGGKSRRQSSVFVGPNPRISPCPPPPCFWRVSRRAKNDPPACRPPPLSARKGTGPPRRRAARGVGVGLSRGGGENSRPQCDHVCSGT